MFPGRVAPGCVHLSRARAKACASAFSVGVALSFFATRLGLPRSFPVLFAAGVSGGVSSWRRQVSAIRFAVHQSPKL